MTTSKGPGVTTLSTPAVKVWTSYRNTSCLGYVVQVSTSKGPDVTTLYTPAVKLLHLTQKYILFLLCCPGDYKLGSKYYDPFYASYEGVAPHIEIHLFVSAMLSR